MKFLASKLWPTFDKAKTLTNKYFCLLSAVPANIPAKHPHTCIPIKAKASSIEHTCTSTLPLLICSKNHGSITRIPWSHLPISTSHPKLCARDYVLLSSSSPNRVRPESYERYASHNALGTSSQITLIIDWYAMWK